MLKVRLRPLDIIAGGLVILAALIWSVYFLRARPSIQTALGGRAPETPSLARPATDAPVQPPAPSIQPVSASDAPHADSLVGRGSPARGGPKIPAEEVRRLFERLRTDKRHGVREEAYARLVRGGLPAEVFKELLSFLREDLKAVPEDPRGLTLLSDLPDAEAYDALMEFSAPEYPKDARIVAIRQALMRTRTSEEMERIEGLFKAEPDPDVRVTVLVAAGTACADLAGDLNRRAVSDESELVRSVAIGLLDASVDRDLLIGRASQDRSDHVRGNALILLQSQMTDPPVLALMLARCSQDECPENRLEAVKALDRDFLRPNASVLQTLAQASLDPSPEVRSHAQKVLERLKTVK